MPEKKDVIRQTDPQSVQLAKTLIRTARYGALAVLDAGDQWPLASRVGVATATDGTPVILISGLSSHTQGLASDARCSLLVGEPSKGDPLAYPRITLVCRAQKVERDTEAHEALKLRYLARHPKAQLYVGLGDFAFHRLEIVRANLNGGFGKAYHLTREDLLCASSPDFVVDEQKALAAVSSAMGPEWGAWRVSGLDPEGIDLMDGDRARRLFFPQPVASAADAAAALASFSPPAA